MTSVKTSKDKQNVTPPRLTSRPTAASVARAARNAANRSLTLNSNQRQSPIRTVPSPTTSKMKTAISRSGQNSNSKTEIKINRNFENEISVLDLDIPTNEDTKVYCTSTGNIQDFRDSKEEITFSRNDCDIHYIPDINYCEVSQYLENVSISPEKESTVIDYTQMSHIPNKSRPQTPKSVTSRPQTPRVPSRPSTPAHPLQRQSTPISRPNTPHRNISNVSSTSLTRPKTPSTYITTNLKPTSPVSLQDGQEIKKNQDEMKIYYLNKQKEFHRLKKELDVQQQKALEVYDGLRNLRESMIGEGLPVNIEMQQDLVVLNVADWASQELSQLCRDAYSSSDTNGAVELFKSMSLDECTLGDMESNASKIPTNFSELCLQAFTARQDLIDWIKHLIEKNEILSKETNAAERIANFNSQGLELYQALHDLKTRADNVVDVITTYARRIHKERSSLVTVGEKLVREIARLRQDLETRSVVAENIREVPSNTEIAKELEQARKLLEEERRDKAAIKDKLAAAETQLRQTRLRVSKMDRQLQEAEASISGLTGTVKTLEDKSRHREVQLEARARKLKESLKTGEVASSQLSHQRDILRNEVKNLKEQIQTLTTKHKSEEQIFNNKLNDFTSALEEEKKLRQVEIKQKLSVEAALQESQVMIQKLKLKLSNLDKNRQNPDLPTEREMEMWAELQSTKDTLKSMEDEIIACKRENVHFLETFTKIAESENKAGIPQKLAAELLNKEEVLGKIQMQMRELSKNNKLYEQKIIQYENFFRELQTSIGAEGNYEDQSNKNYQNLQQELTKLRISLLDALHHKEELSERLAEKEQQLEQQDKTSRAQAKVIKVREELINMLKNKETDQSKKLVTMQQDLEHRMKIVDEVNKQIGAKAEEIQELFTTLENKQQQIHRLEKIVFALEEQQTRSQAQRTRQEEKIATLEHELAAGNKRERKFLFF